jgi:hypothetical protein
MPRPRVRDVHLSRGLRQDTTIFVCIIICAGIVPSARLAVTLLTSQRLDDVARYLNPDVLIDSTSWRWKMKKRSMVGKATTTEAAMM